MTRVNLITQLYSEIADLRLTIAYCETAILRKQLAIEELFRGGDLTLPAEALSPPPALAPPPASLRQAIEWWASSRDCEFTFPQLLYGIQKNWPHLSPVNEGSLRREINRCRLAGTLTKVRGAYLHRSLSRPEPVP